MLFFLLYTWLCKILTQSKICAVNTWLLFGVLRKIKSETLYLWILDLKFRHEFKVDLYYQWNSIPNKWFCFHSRLHVLMMQHNVLFTVHSDNDQSNAIYITNIWKDDRKCREKLYKNLFFTAVQSRPEIKINRPKVFPP